MKPRMKPGEYEAQRQPNMSAQRSLFRMTLSFVLAQLHFWLHFGYIDAKIGP